MQEEIFARFKTGSAPEMQPGASSFFRGAFNDVDTPVAEQQMLAAARTYYAAWKTGDVASNLATIASPELKLCNPCWARKGESQPASRDSAADAMEKRILSAGGELKFEARSVAHAEGTNMVRSSPRRYKPLQVVRTSAILY